MYRGTAGSEECEEGLVTSSAVQHAVYDLQLVCHVSEGSQVGCPQRSEAMCLIGTCCAGAWAGILNGGGGAVVVQHAVVCLCLYEESCFIGYVPQLTYRAAACRFDVRCLLAVQPVGEGFWTRGSTDGEDCLDGLVLHNML